MTQIIHNLHSIQTRIEQAKQRYHRTHQSVALLAVSKQFPAAQIKLLAHAGQTSFGESYLQEALVKIEQLQEIDLEWHFIGPVQSNKTRAIAKYFQWVHSVDRLKIVQQLNQHRPATLPPLNVCIQVNISADHNKAGSTTAQLPELIDAVMACPRLRLRGLMTIPRQQAEFSQQRANFAALRTLFEQAKLAYHAPLDTLSMGMTGDLEAAIAEGSTMVRVGTGIFGTRAPR